MALKPSIRDVLPVGLQGQARVVLASHQKALTGTPWFVRILIGFGAWLASLFLLGFLVIARVLHAESAAMTLGLVLAIGAAGLRRTGDNVFITQLALSIGLAGQALFIGGMGALLDSKTAAAAATLGLQTVLLFLYPDLIQRFLSTLFGGIALLYLLRLLAPLMLVDVTLVGFTLLAHLLFLQQGRLQHGQLGAMVTPTAFGLVTTLFLALLIRTWFQDAYGVFFSRKGAVELPPGLLTLGLTGVTLYTVWRVLEELGVKPQGLAGMTAFAALALIALLTLNTPGVIAALGMLLLGFHRRNVVLLGLAVVFVLTFGVSYYYDLHLTLLAKSLALLGSGLVLLGLRFFILRRFPTAEEVR